MKRTGVSILLACCVIAGAASANAGSVNCAQVNKYLQTGRTVQDVAETMVIAEDEVKKCQAGAQGNVLPANPPAAEPSGGASSSSPEGVKK